MRIIWGGKLSTREEASFSQCFDSVSRIFTYLVTDRLHVPLLLCLTTHQVSDADKSWVVHDDENNLLWICAEVAADDIVIPCALLSEGQQPIKTQSRSSFKLWIQSLFCCAPCKLQRGTHFLICSSGGRPRKVPEIKSGIFKFLPDTLSYILISCVKSMKYLTLFYFHGLPLNCNLQKYLFIERISYADWVLSFVSAQPEAAESCRLLRCDTELHLRATQQPQPAIR